MPSVHLGGRFSVCIYHGKKYGEDKQEALSKADVFVLPTMNDCFPLVILEAMDYCKSVVTTAIGGIPDIVENDKTGLIVRVGNSQSLADNFEKLIVDGELRVQMGEAGLKKFIREFMEEVFEKRIKEILDSCINE